MAGIRKLDPIESKSKWAVEYVDKEGKRRRNTLKSGLKNDADVAARKIEHEMEDGIHVADRASVTLGFAIDEYVKDCERRHRFKHRMSGHYLESIGTAAKAVPTALRRMLIMNVTPRHIQDISDDLAKRFRPNTVRTYIGFYRPVIKFAIKQKWLVVNHLREQPVILPEPDQPKPVPSKEIIRKLLEVLSVQERA